MTVEFLKKILILDAATAIAVFAAAVVFTAPLSALLGLAPAYLVAGGWICLGAALTLGFAGTRAIPSAGLVWLIAFLNFDWVIASFVVFEIEIASLTALGKIAVLAQAAGVLVFAILEAMGARMLGRRRSAAA